jgi:hypothetical protein
MPNSLFEHYSHNNIVPDNTTTRRLVSIRIPQHKAESEKRQICPSKVRSDYARVSNLYPASDRCDKFNLKDEP